MTDKEIDEMTKLACDVYFEELGQKYTAENEEHFREEFQAMRMVMVPVSMRIDELENIISRVKSFCKARHLEDVLKVLENV